MFTGYVLGGVFDMYSWVDDNIYLIGLTQCLMYACL